MLHEIWWEVFHALWGQNKDLIYDEKKWMELQRQLEEVEQDMQTLSRPELLQKYLKRPVTPQMKQVEKEEMNRQLAQLSEYYRRW